MCLADEKMKEKKSDSLLSPMGQMKGYTDQRVEGDPVGLAGQGARHLALVSGVDREGDRLPRGEHLRQDDAA